MSRLLLIITILLCLTGISAAQSGGGYASPFTLGTGARDLALAGANLAQADFATAAYWNASRLARAERYTFATFHSQLYDSDVAYQYFGLAIPTMDFGTFGMGIMRLGIGGIDARDASNATIGEISDNRLRIYLAYGHQLSGFDVGLSASIENHSVYTYKATSSPGLDLSVGKRFDPSGSLINHISIAVNARHVLRPSIKLLDESVRQPFQIDFGISSQLGPSASGSYAVTLAASVTKLQDTDPYMAAGFEFDLQETLQLRAGIRDAHISVGAGLTARGFSFDYALVGRDLDGLHMFTLTTRFGTSASERRTKRARAREDEFNRLMTRQLAQRNQEMIMQQVLRGDELLVGEEWALALARFDRAMFLARNAGSDTTDISARATNAREQVAFYTHARNLEMNVDSAQSRFAVGDHVGVRYFAGVALAIDPASMQALKLLAMADSVLTESAAREKAVRVGLITVDSLISYGHAKAAWNRVLALAQVAPDDARVASARTRARFEWWRNRASEASMYDDAPGTLQALDSALKLYPGHEWCLELQDLTKASMRAAQVAAAPSPAAPPKISAEMEAHVQATYGDAMKAFKDGQLDAAIRKWEDVHRLVPDYQSVREYLVRAYKFVGVELYGQDRLDDAIAVWRRAAILEPDNAVISRYMSRARNELRKLRELSYEGQ